jgi:hypothetical protein
MKKSVVYRTLQIASAVAVYSTVSVWASKNHVNVVSSVLTQIDSLLVIMAIAVGLPYFCFKVLGKLYTPPVSSSSEKSSKDDDSVFSQDELRAKQNMFYRGTPYKPAENKPAENKPAENKPAEIITSVNSSKNNAANSQSEIKYRGASIISNEDLSLEEKANQFSTERAAQKTAKPKERIKYRGSYVD